MMKNDKSNNDLSETAEVSINKKGFYFTLRESANLFIFELEPIIRGKDNVNVIFNMAPRIMSATDLPSLYEKAARVLKVLTGYERVMVYKFLEDGSGEVVGEAIDKHVESFMAQRYPESDIPKQARALYKKSLMRLTADVGAEPVDIVSAGEAEVPDLSYCSLRAASPTHVLYLKNMGVASSYSISIMVDDKLWGLMAFQNCTAPKRVDLRIRQAANLLTGVIASQIAAKNAEASRDLSERFQNAILRLQNYLTLDDSLVKALTGHNINLLNLNNARGVALLYKGQLTTLGETPGSDQIIALSGWICENVDDLFHTDKLAALYPDAKRFLKRGAGILVSILNAEANEMIIWFKREKVYSIQWAGEPVKKVEAGTASGKGNAIKILPRTSFKIIKETIKGTSQKWTAEEVDAAVKITKYIKDQILKRTQKQLEFNEKLQEAYDELDSFTYTVSHDLRTPLTVIRTYAQFLRHSKMATDDKSLAVVTNIMSGADKITFMLQKLLELSKISRQELKVEPVNVRKLIDNVINEQIVAGNFIKTEINIGDTPAVYGNELLLYHVFSNLISNALKYSSKQKMPVVEIKGYRNDGKIIYEIGDNGVGMDEAMQADAFKLFRRLENAADFEGTGAGLAIAKKIMERHGSEISYKSRPGKGTVFYLTFIGQEPAF